MAGAAIIACSAVVTGRPVKAATALAFTGTVKTVQAEAVPAIRAELAACAVIAVGAGVATRVGPAGITHTSAISPNIIPAGTVLAAIRARLAILANEA